MRSNLPADVYAERIENMLAAGFPDILLKATAGRSPVFCETKAVLGYPLRIETTRVFGKSGLTVEQRNWHLLFNKHGGASIIVASCGQGPRTDHWIINGREADGFNDMTKAQLDAKTYSRNRRGAPFWADLATYLKGQ